MHVFADASCPTPRILLVVVLASIRPGRARTNWSITPLFLVNDAVQVLHSKMLSRSCNVTSQSWAAMLQLNHWQMGEKSVSDLLAHSRKQQCTQCGTMQHVSQSASLSFGCPQGSQLGNFCCSQHLVCGQLMAALPAAPCEISPQCGINPEVNMAQSLGGCARIGCDSHGGHCSSSAVQR